MPERSFGRTIRYRRTKLGLSQAKLGELVGRSASAVRLWEKDQSYPSESSVIEALAAILGVDERLLYERAGMEPSPQVESSPTVEEALATLSPSSLVEVTPQAEDRTEPGAEYGTEDESPQPETAAPEHTPSSEVPREASPGYLRPPEPYTITQATPPLVEPSYLEDREQRQLYWVRQLATVVALLMLVLALLWALGEGLTAWKGWWDELTGSLRL